MLCTTGAPPTGDDWQLEVKFDGIRGQLRVDDRGWTLRSRPGHDRTVDFPELEVVRDALAGRSVLLDGEVVVFDRAGRPDFAAVRRRLGGRRADPGPRATFVVWDLLHLDGRAVRALRLRERQAMLADLLRRRGPGFCLAEPLTAPVDQVLAVLAAHQLEGVVAKHFGSRWQPGWRTPHWRKHKLRRRHELRVAAWDPGDDHRPETLYLRDTRERPVGRVGLGHDEAERAALQTAIDERLLAARCSGRIRPLSPGLLVTVDAHGADGQPLRDPILRAWRADPDAPLSARQPPAVARRRPRSPQARL